MSELQAFYEQMARVLIVGPVVEETRTNERGEYTTRTQKGMLSYSDSGAPVSIPCIVRLERNDPPYALGEYAVAGSSLQVSRYKDLEVNRYQTRLVRVPEVFAQLLKAERDRVAK